MTWISKQRNQGLRKMKVSSHTLEVEKEYILMHTPFKASSLIKNPSIPQYNQWLWVFLTTWKSHPNCIIPTQRIGEEIILALLQHPSEIPLISHNSSLTTVHLIDEPTFSSGIKPTLAMVFHDLMEGDKDGLLFNV